MIFLVIPIFNEEENIPGLIMGLRKKLAEYDYKIIAVNDGSLDNSLKILNDLKENDMIIESSIVNMNVGAVFSVGLARAVSESKNDDDIVIIMEGDQTSSMDVLLQLIIEINKKQNDIVIASRYKKGGGFVKFPFFRRILSQNASRLMRYFFHISNAIYDYSIFFRAYNIGILKKAFQYFGHFGLIQSKGFVANAELLVKLSMITDRISEIPFVYDYSRKKGRSKIRIIRTITEYFVVLSYLRSVANKVENIKKLELKDPYSSKYANASTKGFSSNLSKKLT